MTINLTCLCKQQTNYFMTKQQWCNSHEGNETIQLFYAALIWRDTFRHGVFENMSFESEHSNINVADTKPREYKKNNQKNSISSFSTICLSIEIIIYFIFEYENNHIQCCVNY